MSNNFSIEYLPIAEKDLNEILEYVALDNPQSALKLLDEIDNTIIKLEDFPYIGIIPKESRLQLLNYRTHIVGSYLVFYVVKSDIVEIRRVLHGKRNYDFLL